MADYELRQDNNLAMDMKTRYLDMGDNTHALVVSLNARIVSATAEFARPANTTAYTAGDVVSNSVAATSLLEFSSVIRTIGRSGYLVGAQLSTDKKSITPRIRVHLFNVNTPTVSADNAAHQEKYADRAKRLCSFDLPAMITGTDTTNSNMSRSEDMSLRIPIIAATEDTDVYGFLEALDAFTPASQQAFSLTLYFDQN